jgi:hypothetical protein
MPIADCALSGPGLAFMFCVARIRELEAARRATPPIECVVRPSNAESDPTKTRPIEPDRKGCVDSDSRQAQ